MSPQHCHRAFARSCAGGQQTRDRRVDPAPDRRDRRRRRIGVGEASPIRRRRGREAEEAMKELVRGTDLVGLPIVTLAGDDIAEVRDVMFDGDAGHIVGFTLNKRGRLTGRMKEVLTREQVKAVGPAAVMIDPSTDFGPAPIETSEKGWQRARRPGHDRHRCRRRHGHRRRDRHRRRLRRRLRGAPGRRAGEERRAAVVPAAARDRRPCRARR